MNRGIGEPENRREGERKQSLLLRRFTDSPIRFFSGSPVPRFPGSSLLPLALSLLLLTACASAPKPEPDLVWPLPPETPRIKFVRSISSSADVRPASFAQRLRTTIIGDEQTAALGKPYAVHADRKGRVFVADSAWRKVLVFDETGKDFFILGTDGPGLLINPRGVTTDAEGRIYVTDVTQNRVVVYGETGDFQLAMGLHGQLDKPVGVAVNDALKRVYVVSTGSTATQTHKVTVFDAATGNLLFEFGGRGVEDGRLNFPTNIVVDAAGKVYVMDSFNFRVQIFDADGRFLSKFGGIGTGFGQFSKPKGIGVDSEGHIYVSDAAFNNIQIFDQDGRLLLFFGEMGSRPGQFWLPAGLAVDAHDRIYVADQYNKRINVYQYLSEAGRSDGGEPRMEEPAAN
jgi:DNA-binding beta-propeller fold protein YncE